MDILRRNTDYALRIMVNLATHYNNGAMPVKQLAREEYIPYQFACKILQKLHDIKLVDSFMGPKGGFTLNRDPAKITLLEIVQAVQGPLCLSGCILGRTSCPKYSTCNVTGKLAGLQSHINDFLNKTTLKELALDRTQPNAEGDKKYV